MQIGTDIVEVKRVEKAIQSNRFLEKYFTPQEIALIKSKKEKAAAATAAANFAGKEAVAKALGTGFGVLQLTDIEILRNELGAPYVNLYGVAKSAATEVKISLSHSKEYAVAMVIVI